MFFGFRAFLLTFLEDVSAPGPFGVRVHRAADCKKKENKFVKKIEIFFKKRFQNLDFRSQSNEPTSRKGPRR